MKVVFEIPGLGRQLFPLVLFESSCLSGLYSMCFIFSQLMFGEIFKGLKRKEFWRYDFKRIHWTQYWNRKNSALSLTLKNVKAVKKNSWKHSWHEILNVTLEILPWKYNIKINILKVKNEKGEVYWCNQIFTDFFCAFAHLQALKNPNFASFYQELSQLIN